MWRKLMLSVLGLILAATFSACAVDIAIGDDCVDDFDCPADAVCDPVDLICVVADDGCVSTDECPDGLACGEDGVCDEYTCDEGCPTDSICDVDGFCN